MISFVVPAHNEEQLLARTLRALHAAGQCVEDDYEIIVVDDASSDRTAHLARREGARVTSVHHRQIAATRNSGARDSRGATLIFVDADTIVPEKTVEAAITAIRGGAAGGGARVVFEGVVPLYAKVLLPLILWIFRTKGLAGGCFIFCTRAAFERAGGFDERLFAAEEIGFSRALGRIGDFVILREPVITSGRKLRAYSTLGMLWTMTRLAVGGRRILESRDGLDLWYSDHGDDPTDASCG